MAQPKFGIPRNIERAIRVMSCLGCAVSGLTPDARTMIERARTEALVSFSELVNTAWLANSFRLPFVLRF
jgi:20S proteasome alpha/beta subunit